MAELIFPRLAKKKRRLGAKIREAVQGLVPMPLRIRERKSAHRPGVPFVMVVSHEATRTGAPILAWNICRVLQQQYNVVAVLLGDGGIVHEFEEVCSAVIGPYRFRERRPELLEPLIRRSIERYKPAFVVVNSMESRSVLSTTRAMGVRSILLIHEYYLYYNILFNVEANLQAALEEADHVVLPAKAVQDSLTTDRTRSLMARSHVLPQGQSLIPSGGVYRPKGDGSDALSTFLARFAERPFLVLGAGPVGNRKGADLFVATMAEIVRIAPELPIAGIWVGGPGDRLYSNFVAAQVVQCDLTDRVAFVGERSDIADIYPQADVFFLSSRLDPLPNVAIDAMHGGIPVLCFSKSTGLAEYLAEDPVTAGCVLPLLSTEAAAREIVGMQRDPARRAALSERVKAIARSRFDMERYVAALVALGKGE